MSFTSLMSLRVLFYIMVATSTITILFLLQKESHKTTSGQWLIARNIRLVASSNSEESRPRHDQNRTSVQEKQFCFKEEFMDIVLVISVIKSVSYERIPLLQSIYGQYFPHIVFCGSFDVPTGAKYNLLVVPIKHGLLAYECLAATVRRSLQYKGYLFIKDDIFINLWQLARLDRTRIWASREQLGSQAMFTVSRDQWIWWYTPWGLQACQNAYKDIIQLNSLRKQQTDDVKDKPTLWDVENSLNALLWNGRGSYRCFRSFSNIFYIPKMFSIIFEQISAIFQRHQVFMDVAVPTILRMLELEGKTVELGGIDIGRIYGEDKALQKPDYFWKHFNHNTTYTRPVLFSNLQQDFQKRNILDFLLNQLKRTNKCSRDGT